VLLLVIIGAAARVYLDSTVTEARAPITPKYHNNQDRRGPCLFPPLLLQAARPASLLLRWAQPRSKKDEDFQRGPRTY
jgi:hypothetical protein